jgi:hypothetical protein
MKTKPVLMGVILAGFLSIGSAFAGSISVEYTLSDLGSGQWQYDYRLEGSFFANWGAAIYFPSPDYGAPITDVGTGGADWLTFALQPDASIPAPGEFDIIALINQPDLAAGFAVTFYWSGSGAPGSQRFDLFDFTSGADPLGSGVTTHSPQVVPEPSCILLSIGFSAVALCTIRRRNPT